MEEKQKSPSRTSNGKVLTAVLFILAGVLLFARNSGMITNEWFDLLMAWHSLFILISIYAFSCKRFYAGSVMLVIGVYLLGNKLMLFPDNAQALLWPLVLVLVGIFFLRPHHNKPWDKHKMYRARMAKRMMDYKKGTQEEGQCQSEDGFLNSDNALTGARHVVLDEIFKGANIRTYFGGTTIDLRHTHLASGETFIDLDCNWGGIELFVPTDWKVRIECSCFCGGCNDERWKGAALQEGRVLIIRGNISFGGLEIKE